MSNSAPNAPVASVGAADIDPAAMKEHVACVLRSVPFARAPKMQRFLAFLVDETLAGRAAQLKEYTIATHVFGKPADFEPGTSATVRVEAGRLRKLLMQYRVEHGANDGLVLEVPKGSYVPAFRRALEGRAEGAAGAAAATEVELPTAPLSPSAWSGPDERRLVTVISCALGNDHEVSLCSGDAGFLRAFDVFHELCASIARSHGGSMDVGASQRLIIYFGWPSALEDAAGRALTAALGMIAAVRGGLASLPFGARIGIASSEVISRGSTQKPASRPIVIGAAPTLAASLVCKAPLDGILVAESTRHLAGPAFEFVPAGTLQEPGREPQLLWRLLKPMTVLTRFRATHVGAQFAIIGRREEMALIMSRWQLSLQGEGHGVAVSGEAGIGKSTLVESVLEEIEDGGEQIRVQCSSHHSNSTLYPFIELIKHQLDAAVGGEASEELRLERFLAGFGMADPVERALLAALLFDGDEAALSAVSASQRKDMTLDLLRRLVCARVERRPTVLLVEDVHWADPTTIELLQDILRVARGLRLLVLLTSRADVIPNCSQQTNVTTLRLNRLPGKDCDALIDRVRSNVPLSDATRALIVAKAEGIPLFLEELTKLFLAADEERLRQARVPDSLSGLLASQLDRLGATRGVAQVAAVIGRQFTREMLIAACGEAEQVDAAIDRLLAAGILIREGLRTPHVFSFRHALLRDAAYGSLLDHRRRDLHHRIGSLLVDSFPEVAVEHPEVVAGHLMEAGRHDDAIPFWIDAGRKAVSRYALSEAIADFRLALEAVDALPEGGDDRERELEVLIELGRVIRHARGYGDDELLPIYQRARELSAGLNKSEQLADVSYALWTHAAGRGQWRNALQLATEFANLVREMEDSQLEVEAFRLLGASAAFRGEFPIARHHFERALAIYDVDRHGPRFGFDPGAASAAYLSWTEWHLGDRAAARRYATRALQIGEAKNHATTLGMVLSWLVFYEVCERNVDAIIVLNERLQTVCSQRDCRYWQPFGAACAHWAEFQRDGEPRRLERLLEAAAQFRERYLTSCLWLMAADICRSLGRIEHGLQLVESAMQFAEEHDERVWEAECSRLQAELLMCSPSPDTRRARKLLGRAMKIAGHQQAVALKARAAAGLAALEE